MKNDRRGQTVCNMIRLSRCTSRVVLILSAISGLASAQGAFSPNANMNYTRVFHTATLLADGTVLIAGGNDFGVPPNAEIYDPNSGVFTMTGPPQDYPVNATLLADGRVLLVGGTVEIYDPATRTFAATGAAGYGCAATLLNNGKVLLTDDPAPYGTSATAQLFDPSTGSLAPTGAYASLEIAQMDRTNFPGEGGWDCRRATLLADGRVLVAGGVAAEIYDPQTNSFSLTEAPHTLVSGWLTNLTQWGDPVVATLLPNGMVLFTGGDQDLGPSTFACLFDPSTRTFQPTGTMTSARAENPLTLLPDGTVLVSGGVTSTDDVDTAELYFASARAFSLAGEMITPRWGHTATLLANGKVLITGGAYGTGANGSGLLSSTEIYTPDVVIPTPRLFLLPGDTSGVGAIWHGVTGLAVTLANPATAGEVLSTFTSNLISNGVIPPRVIVGDRFADVVYFGPAPGFPGYFQINFRVPANVETGPAIHVALSYLNRRSNQVTIAIH